MKNTNSEKWYGLKYPDSDLVGLVMKYARPNEDDIAIDIGCGTGRHIKFLNEIGYNAFGIDADKDMIEGCKKNGVKAYQTKLEDFKTDKKIKLAIGWGLSMCMLTYHKDNLRKMLPEIINAEYVILDWRTKGNSFCQFEDNTILPTGEIIINKKGHTLEGIRYSAFDREECVLEGYEIIANQKITKELDGDINEWYQIVYKKL